MSSCVELVIIKTSEFGQSIRNPLEKLNINFILSLQDFYKKLIFIWTKIEYLRNKFYLITQNEEQTNKKNFCHI